jgi:DNA polymerase-3 subunit gamma/tau
MAKRKSPEEEKHGQGTSAQPIDDWLPSHLPQPRPRKPQPQADPYVVLARKYRPQTFDDLIGQEAMVQTLKNAFATGRIAQGFMLTGVRGVGKTTTARILARALNYETETVKQPTIEMAELGRHCAEIMESRHPDVIEMDAASNTGVDNVREIIESARYKPILARTKVFIIDEVHMLSKGAFNALLKTLEEPPEHVKFIFATTEIRKVPVTVLSRCQRFDLRRIDVPALTQHLAGIAAREGVKADRDALAMIARAAEGSVRDGLSILDQAIAMSSKNVTREAVRVMLGLADRGRIFDLLEHVFRGDAANALKDMGALYKDGADPIQLTGDLAEAVHVTTRIKVAGNEAGGEGLSEEERRRAASLAERLSIPLLSRAWQMLLKGLEEVARAPDPVAALEMVLIRLAYTADLPPPDEIIKALTGEGVAIHRGPAAAQAPPSDRRAPLNDVGGEPPSSDHRDAPPTQFISADDAFDAADYGTGPEREAPPDDPGLFEGLEVPDSSSDMPAPLSTAIGMAMPRSFLEVVTLASARRDPKLKYHLEEHVSLVKFDALSGSIDLFLLPGAPPELANELREKLNKWTGRRWIVMLSKAPGDRTLGEMRREREAAELARLRQHPAVAAILDTFPDAKITAIREINSVNDDETGTG